LREALEDEVGEVRFGGDEEIGPLAAGEHDELVDEAGHALELIADELERVLAVLGIIAHDSEMTAHDGDRGAQLVTGVVEELPLPVEGGFEPVEHPVEGIAEVGDVIVALDLDPPG